MLYRQRIKILLILFIILFPLIAFASVKKPDFISTILPEIEKAKVEIGGDALKIPNSLVLVQAILESGRGTSSKAKSGNNFFGIKRGGNYARFNHYREGIKYYIITLMTHHAYKDLRKHFGSDSLTLIKHLGKYAEDPRYKEKMAKIIKSDNLMSFDS